MALKLKDLKYNTLNDTIISAETPSSDRRRLSPLAAMRKGLEMVYARNAQSSQVYALVIHAQEIQGPATYTNRIGLLQAQSVAGGTQGDTAPQQQSTWEYKVRTFKSDACMPLPNSGTDKVLRSDITIYSNLPTPIPVGSLVVIQYEDPINNINPRIISNQGSVAIEGVMGSTNAAAASLEGSFQAVPSGPLAPGDMQDYRGKLVPGTIEGCADTARTGYKPKGNILDEEIITSTIVPLWTDSSKKWKEENPGAGPVRKRGFIKGKKSFIRRVEKAYTELKQAGYTVKSDHPEIGKEPFIVGDAYRSFETQRRAYMQKGQPGQVKWDPRTQRSKVAHPCRGYHTEGQAIDLWGGAGTREDILAHGVLYNKLYDVGLRRINREFWHWSVGEADGHRADGTGGHPRNKIFAAGVQGSPADTYKG